MNTPLEEILPNIFGKYDEEQKFLIKNNCKDLVLIENATEILNIVKDSPCFLENFFHYIISRNKSDYEFLGSYTFRIVKNKHIKQNITRKTNKNVIQIGLDFGHCGHYGIIINNNGKIILFDSMQYEGSSVYSNIFFEICKDIFGVYPEMSFFPIEEKCLQISGGFIQKRYKKESDNDWLKRIQSMESQNHFCYFWTIWYFDMFLTNKLDLKYIENPLFVIKKYIYKMLKLVYPDIKILFKQVFSENSQFLLKFFKKYFIYIWNENKTIYIFDK